MIIFYDTYDPIDDSECAICLNVRDDLHQLEADFFDRADFIYLQRRLDGTSAVADAYGVRLKYGIQMLVVDAEGDLLHKFYELPIENEGLGSTAGDLKVQQLTVSLNRLLGEKVGG